MTGKKLLGLEDDEAENGADAPASDADAQPGGDIEAGRDANGPPPANAAASARRNGGKPVGNRGEAASGTDAPKKSGDDDGMAGDSDGIAQLRRLVSELVTGAEKKTASKLARLEKQGKTLAESVEANTTNLRQLVEREPGAGAESEAAAGGAAKLLERTGTHAADFGRWVELERRGRRWWWTLAVAVGFPAFLLLGLLVEQQFQVIPLHDPTGGWRGHVWEQYGRIIVDCAVEAMRIDAEVDELLSKVGDGGFQAARSISFSPSLNLTPSTISARR